MQASNDNQNPVIDVLLFDVVAFMTDCVEIETDPYGRHYFPAPYDECLVGPYGSEAEARERYRLALTTLRRFPPA